MSKLRPYIALDIETTGLDLEKSQILQVGWVIDDGVSPRDQLKKGSFFIDNGPITYGETFALAMNAWIFKELSKPESERKYHTCNLVAGMDLLLDAVLEAAELAKQWDVENGHKAGGKVQLAGKNVANFDWPIIVNQLETVQIWRWMEESLQSVDHRFIDCGAIYFDDFGKNPGFAAINKLIGVTEELTHDALDDAMAVVIAVRHKVGIKT